MSTCCGKHKPPMSPLRKQGSGAKELDSRSFDPAQDRFRGNDKSCFHNRYQLLCFVSLMSASKLFVSKTRADRAQVLAISLALSELVWPA